MEVPPKLAKKILYDPSMSLLGIYPRECKSACNRDT
jgi:hypothetical protein